MPTYCDPWPGNTKASFPGAGPAPKKSPSGVLHEFLVGWPCNMLRPLATKRPTSVRSFSITISSRAALPAWNVSRRRHAEQRRCSQDSLDGEPAKSVKASASFSRVSADQARIWTLPSQSTSVFSGRYSSNTQWKLLPPKPNELTAARRE